METSDDQKADIGIDEIERLAQLSKIKLSDEEQKELAQELKLLLNHFNQVNLSSTNNNHNPSSNFSNSNLRDDHVAAFENAADQLVELAPQSQGRLYKTPLVL